MFIIFQIRVIFQYALKDTGGSSFSRTILTITAAFPQSFLQFFPRNITEFFILKRCCENTFTDP